jgi:hypothetical protein
MKLNHSIPTEFYVSEVGYLVIKQECMECGRDSMFLLSPEQTKLLFSKADEILKEQKECWTGFQDEIM